MISTIEMIMEYPVLFVPHILLIISFVSLLIATVIKRRRERRFGCYYNFHKYSKVKKDALDITNDILMFVYSKFIALVIVYIISIASYQLLGEQIKEIWCEITENIPHELLDWFGVITTMIAMLVAFKKEYYLVFSIADILEQYKFRKKTMSIIFMMFCVKICGVAINVINKYYNCNDFIIFILKNIKICSHIWSLYLCINLIYRILNVLFAQERTELKLLDRLYSKLNSHYLISPNCYEENVAGVKINCNYLSGKYLLLLNKKRVSEFQNIDLKSAEDKAYVSECFDSTVYIINKMACKYLTFASAYYITLEILVARISKQFFWENAGDTCTAIVLSWLMWGISFLLLGLIEEREFVVIKQMLNRIYYAAGNTYTYEDSERNKNELCIFGWKTGKKDKEYFEALFNIAIYWKLLVDGNNNSNKKAFIDQLEKNIEHINKNNEQDSLIDMLIPICIFIEYIGNNDYKDENIFKKYKIDSFKYKEFVKDENNQKFMKAIISNISSLGDEDDILQAMDKFVKLATT